MAFSYTTTGKEERSSGLIPIGEYDAVIIKSTDEISKSSGRDMIKLEIDTGRGHLWEYLVDGGKNTGERIREILESCGRYRPGMAVSSTTFLNLRGRIKVKHATENGETAARINYWIKPKPGQTAAPAQPPPANSPADDIPF